jgi:capsular polysaccharide biosynthesis protein
MLNNLFSILKKKVFLFIAKKKIPAGNISEKLILPERIQVRNPIYFQTLRNVELLGNEKSRNFPEVQLKNIKNCIISSEGLIFCNHEIVKGCNAIRMEHYKDDFYNNLLWNKKQRTIEKPIYSLHFLWSSNFNHWLNDILPKLQLLYSKGELNENLPILLPYNHSGEYIKASLQAYGINNFEIIKANEFIFCSSCIHIGLTAPVGNQYPELMNAVRLHFNNSLKVNKGKRFWLTRQGEKFRFLENEEEIKPILKKYNFEIINPGKYSFIQQVRLFSDCECIGGIHGAALTNMLFMPPGQILELRLENDNHNNVFFTLAESLNHNYDYLECKSTSGSIDIHFTNLRVEPDKLKIKLEKLFNEYHTT